MAEETKTPSFPEVPEAAKAALTRMLSDVQVAEGMVGVRRDALEKYIGGLATGSGLNAAEVALNLQTWKWQMLDKPKLAIAKKEGEN